MVKPEDRARERIDEALAEAGWAIGTPRQPTTSRSTASLSASSSRRAATDGLTTSSSTGNAVGVVEATKEFGPSPSLDGQSETHSLDLASHVPGRPGEQSCFSP